MRDQWFEKWGIILLPIALFVIFAASYYITQTYFIECKGEPGEVRAGCEAVNVEYIFKSTDDRLETTPSALGADIEVYKMASRGKNAERFGGRYTWVFSFMANTLVGLAAIGIFLGVITKWSNTFKKGTGAGADREVKGISTFLSGIPWTYVCLIAAIILIAVPLFSPETYMPTTRKILEKTIQARGFGMASITRLIDFLNGLTFAATILFVFGLCVLAFPRSEERVFKDIGKSDDTAKKSVETAVKKLVEKKKDLRLMLFVAAFLLVICIVRLNSTQTWTLTFMEKDAAEAMKIFYKDFSTVLGGFFTLLLGAIYIPTAFIINKRGEILSRGIVIVPAAAPDEASPVIKPDFKFSIYDSLPKMLAIAAPLLATPFASLLGGF